MTINSRRKTGTRQPRQLLRANAVSRVDIELLNQKFNGEDSIPDSTTDACKRGRRNSSSPSKSRSFWRGSAHLHFSEEGQVSDA